VERGLRCNRIVSICPPATTIGLVDKFVQALHITSKTRDILIKHIEMTFGKNLWQELSMSNTVKTIGIPGLVIHDAQDIDIPWEEGQAVAYAWDNAPFIITNELGHRRILRDSAVIESAVKFIQNR
jgi:pimeloyl-ACP methyl ester carboxylesterase